MSFDLDALHAAVRAHARVTRVVIADVSGSSPREVGAAMLVWGDAETGGQSGTIGGGALEFSAARAARTQAAPRRLSRHALGPELGQCCGGSVVLLSEVYDARALEALTGEAVARPVADAAAMPLSVRRLLDRARARGERPEPQLIDGWMVEPVTYAARQLWIWGAGHVGRALVDVLAPLPDLAITWVDTGVARFPAQVPDAVTMLPAAAPADLVAYAPPRAAHLVLTYSHALDLELCHRLLSHDFDFAGLIGSATKWGRFRSRLRALGHAPDRIARITCPIGDPAFGKHPQQIAIGVAAQLIARRTGAATETRERA
ncbi:xanthine dehydrogenase accessory protein XdhC [Pseudodonghicola flavimaris]|uniref:Xanthine dehydrogenase accessory protein XdhC n=1 Tax=Pseudodonghicola flavimaris TaxID=3050036 RepID=A0ABT7EYH2_9RHOB|nr:xanthine dehydrogenase accessory protein XdhC [Pseudodonghicola flavimaris]MDK3017396.1 xanthine dehydrogenase accessory protein XdhC [Pseudodonghicola flavimaris]